MLPMQLHSIVLQHRLPQQIGIGLNRLLLSLSSSRQLSSRPNSRQLRSPQALEWTNNPLHL